MQNQTPTVVVGRDMSPELFVDVSATLSSLGVVVESDGFTATPRQSKVIVVVSPKGGAGKTAVSSNLSVALAQRHPGRVVAVDLDVQFGDLSLALSLSPERTLAQLARSSQIDATTLKLHLTPTTDGLFVLAGANDPVDADSIGHAHVSKVLPMLAENFDFVVVMDFADFSAARRYVDHPLHRRYVEDHATEVVGERVVVQHDWTPGPT